MIARLLISPDLSKIKKEINRILVLHLPGVDVNHPDILYFQAGEKLGIAEARKIKGHFTLKPYQTEGKVVIIEDAGTLTPEAQNALLKTLEEPPKEAILILGAGSDAYLLPTILSRCEMVRLDPTDSASLTNNTYEVYVKDLEKLLSSTIEQRFEYVEKLKNREEFLHSLVEYFHQNLLNYPEFAKELLQAEKWDKQNVNIRAILEYLMLVMPRKEI